MLRTLALCVFLLFVNSTGGSSFPQDSLSGNWLLVSCQFAVRSNDDKNFNEDHFEAYRDGFCRGMIEGVSDTSPKVCTPEDVIYGQEQRVVLKYLQDHPEELHLRNTLLVEKALAKSFPCRK